MGYLLHRVMVVSGFNVEHVAEANSAASSIFGAKGFPGLVTGLHQHAVNGDWIFFIAPDGSKEGWDSSDKGDQARNEFVTWLEAARKRQMWLTWVEVVISDEAGEPRVERSNARGDD